MLLRICSETFNLTSKVINGELLNVQDGFQIGKGITGQITSICWIVKKQGSSMKTLTSASLNMLKIWLCGSQQLGKFLKRWGVQIYLICFLRYLYMGQETTVWMTHETMDWFKIGKKVWQSCILSPCLFNFCAKHIKWNPGLDESQTGIRIAGGNNNSRYISITLMAENKVELKSLLMKVREESEKAGLKLTIKTLRWWRLVPPLHGKQKWGKWKQWQIFFSWAPKSLWMVTAAMKVKDAWSLEGKLWQTLTAD